MELVTMLATVVTFPIVCLSFLLWMAHLEDTLPAAVRRAGRQPDPAPIREVPVGPFGPAPAVPLPQAGASPLTGAGEPAPVHLPVQRHGPVAGAHPHGEAEPAPTV